MTFDLQGEQGMDPVVGMLYGAVKENVNRLKAIVTSMSQEEMDYKGITGESNSIGQLMKHLAYVDVKWVYRLKGESLPDELEEKYGPELDQNNNLPEVKGVSLEALLTEYDQVFRMFKQVCYELTDRDLMKVVTYENGKGATIRWGIWHMADHNRYHQAYINQLRKWYKEK